MESRLVEFTLYLIASSSALLGLLNIPRLFSEQKTTVFVKAGRLSLVFFILALLPIQWLVVDYLKMKSSDVGIDGTSIILWALGIIIPLFLIYFYKWVTERKSEKESD